MSTGDRGGGSCAITWPCGCPSPRDRAGISVGGQIAHWEEGRSLLFDDSYEHFAWNDTDGVRVVLFVE